MKPEEQLEYLANNKDINMQYIQSIKELFEKSLITNDFYSLNCFSDYVRKDGFIMTGIVNKLQTVCLICTNEIEIKHRVLFTVGVRNADEAIDKLNYLVLMLRRIEMDPYGDFSKPAYEFIKENNISEEAIIVALKRGAFEWECNIVKCIYEKVIDMLDTHSKLEWLSTIIGNYKDNYLIIKLAELLLEEKQYRNAYDVLRLIENPSREISELIEEMSDIINE